jgi:hypothetical protein
MAPGEIRGKQMAKDDDRGVRLGSLELEPKDGAAKPATGKAVFHPNTRSKGSDRRTKDDRRDDVRLTEARRKGSRRPKAAWDDISRR